MTNRVTLPSQDFEKMCKQAERDQEAKKLVVLMERVKQQIAARDNGGLRLEPTKVTNPSGSAAPVRLPSRSVPFER